MRKPKRMPRICMCGHLEAEHSAYTPAPCDACTCHAFVAGASSPPVDPDMET